MTKEYNSILQNDVWEIVPRPEGKSMIDSRWLYKVKHVVDGSIENTRQGLLLEGSHRKRESIMMRHLHQLPDTLLFIPFFP
jgi:hypothetical protein